MARYSVQGHGQTSNNTLLSHGVIASNATPRRFRIWDIVLGSAASPNDGTFNVNVIRTTTAAGTSTAANPVPLDPADAAAITTGGITFTVNPTLSTQIMVLGFNQRSTVRWFAAPGEELVVAATQFNGIGLQPASPSPTASNLAGTIVIDE
jgi:hypothetical protein